MDPALLQYGPLGLLALVLLAVGKYVRDRDREGTQAMKDMTEAVRAMHASLGQILTLLARLNNVPPDKLADVLGNRIGTARG